MKRLFTTLTLLLLAATGWAQNDSTITSGIAQDDTSAYWETAYSAPNRNPIYYFGSPFANHFVEVDFLINRNDLGIGATYAYLPEVWGGHITGIVGFASRWLMVGADYRLSKPWNKADWHLYGSLGYRHGTSNGDFLSAVPHSNLVYRPALGVGIRLSCIPTRGSFCMESASLGMLTDFHTQYVTVGISVSLAALLSILFLECMR